MRNVLKKKLEAVKSLEERGALKELIEQVVLPMAEYQKDRWDRLEERVFNEIRLPEESHDIVVGMCDKRSYDPVHTYLFPILPPETADLAAIGAALAGEAPVELFSVFVDAEWSRALDILSAPSDFPVRLHAGSQVVHGTCRLIPDFRYKDALRDVYRSFVKHDLPWKTVPTPYIDRMARAVMTKWDKFPSDATLSEIDVEFGDLSDVLRHDRVLLWNVKRLEMKGDAFVLPLEETSVFEHRVDIEKSGAAHGYLVSAREQSVRFVRREAEELVITADEPKVKAWDVYKIVRPQETQMNANPPYPLFSNRRRLTFTDTLATRSTPIFSFAEIMRRIEAYEFPLEVRGIEVTEEKLPAYTHGTMNEALDDAFSHVNAAKSLCVSFVAVGDDDSYAEDRIRFLMSELQTKFPGYGCAGKLL
jgi:hypothetical protein